MDTVISTMKNLNHSQILHTRRTRCCHVTGNLLGCLTIVVWLSGCGTPAEKNANRDTAASITTAGSDVPAGGNSESVTSTLAEKPNRSTTRLIPPQKPSPVPTVSNELIVADTVINQSESTVVPNELADTDTPALAAAAPKRLVEPEADEEQAAEKLEQLTILAVAGDVDAQLALADSWATGPTVDKSEAHYWYQLAAEQGSQVAQYKLGLQYFRGDGVARDYALAREWWLESATLGSADAQQKLGYLYSEALGVERDYNRAILWYTRAAQLGHAEAQTLLGSLYHEGNRVPRNYDEAFKWYKMAAERGHPHSQYTLATLYHDGFGTEQDFVKCTAWVDVALANGYIDEFNAREECTKHLTDAELAEASVLAKRWKTSYLDQPDYN